MLVDSYWAHYRIRKTPSPQVSTVKHKRTRAEKLLISREGQGGKWEGEERVDSGCKCMGCLCTVLSSHHLRSNPPPPPTSPSRGRGRHEPCGSSPKEDKQTHTLSFITVEGETGSEGERAREATNLLAYLRREEQRKEQEESRTLPISSVLIHVSSWISWLKSYWKLQYCSMKFIELWFRWARMQNWKERSEKYCFSSITFS